MQVTARVTVTPDNLELRETLDELLELGFDGVPRGHGIGLRGQRQATPPRSDLEGDSRGSGTRRVDRGAANISTGFERPGTPRRGVGAKREKNA